MSTRKTIFAFVALIALSAGLIAQGDVPPDVVARIGEQDITIDDVQSFDPEMVFQFKHFFERPMGQVSSGRRQIDDRERENILEQSITQRLMIEDARAQDLDKDADFLSAMARFEDYILLNTYYNKVIRASIQPTDEELRAEYDRSGRFTRPATAKVISIWSHDELSLAEATDKLKRATKDNVEELGLTITDMRIPEGEDGEMMQQKTNMRSADGQEGDLDPMMQVMLALKDAKAGDIIGPKGRDNHFLTVKVIEKHPAGKIPFEEVREQIERELVDREFHRVLEEKQRELRRKAVVTIYYENLDKAFE
ncbi:MAG TPA: peptidyl-prolyl cis-trans isomerase [candidate division Zixibacteria bacterium]|nr:peptidyl-prolyl cis-trans isomerase [candidate division Zixibacteria bacterium]